MSCDLPSVSIITPAYNAGRYLSATVESVLRQDYPNLEYLVVDRYSSDETGDILRRYEGRLRRISGGDLGPAGAIHLGLSQARSHILAWLNADDTYAPGAIRAAVNYLQAHPDIDVVYGEAHWIDAEGTQIRRYPTIPFDAAALQRDCFICQPAAFFRASVYETCPLAVNLPVSFDYDLWIRMAAQDRRFGFLPQPLANSRMHGRNLTLMKRREVFEVTIDLLRRHYGYAPLSWVFNYTAFRMDGRDQFFEPLRHSPFAYLASLPVGFAMNPTQKRRYFTEWAATPFRSLVRSRS